MKIEVTITTDEGFKLFGKGRLNSIKKIADHIDVQSLGSDVKETIQTAIRFDIDATLYKLYHTNSSNINKSIGIGDRLKRLIDK